MLIIMKEFQCIVNKPNARIHWMSSIYPSNWFASSATRKRSRKPINMFDVAVLLYNLIKIILRILKARAKNCNVHSFFFLSFRFWFVQFAGFNDASWSGNDLDSIEPTNDSVIRPVRTLDATTESSWNGLKEIWFGLIQTLAIRCQVKSRKFIMLLKWSSCKLLSMEK